MKFRNASVPPGIIMDTRLFARDVRVWAAIHMVDCNGFPKKEDLVLHLQITRPALEKCLEKLVATGWLSPEFAAGMEAASLPWTKRRAVPSHIRAQVFYRAKSTCFYCGQKHDYLEIDHVIPVAASGSNDISNLVAACIDCNVEKGFKDAVRFGGGAPA